MVVVVDVEGVDDDDDDEATAFVKEWNVMLPRYNSSCPFDMVMAWLVRGIAQPFPSLDSRSIATRASSKEATVTHTMALLLGRTPTILTPRMELAKEGLSPWEEEPPAADVVVVVNFGPRGEVGDEEEVPFCCCW